MIFDVAAEMGNVGDVPGRDWSSVHERYLVLRTKVSSMNPTREAPGSTRAFVFVCDSATYDQMISIQFFFQHYIAN